MSFLHPEFKEIEGIKYFKFNSKFEEFKYKFHTVIMIVLFLLVICFMMFTMIFIYRNAEAFYQNPFVFGASKMNATCECMTGEGIWFGFDGKEFRGQSIGGYRAIKNKNTIV